MDHLVCPACGTAIPDEDLTTVIYFYGGDAGLVDCPECGVEITWEMKFTARRPDGTVVSKRRRSSTGAPRKQPRPDKVQCRCGARMTSTYFRNSGTTEVRLACPHWGGAPGRATKGHQYLLTTTEEHPALRVLWSRRGLGSPGLTGHTTLSLLTMADQYWPGRPRLGGPTRRLH